MLLAVGRPQFLKPRQNLFNFLLPMLPTISGTDSYSSVLPFSRTSYQDEIVLCQLSVADLLGKRVVPKVSISVKASVMELLSHRISIFIMFVRHWHNDNLTGGDPERPLSCPVLCQDCEGPLHAAKNSTVNNNRPGVCSHTIDPPPWPAASRASLSCGLMMYDSLNLSGRMKSS